MGKAGSILQYAGGRFGAVAASGLIAGTFIVLVGVTPAQFVVGLLRNPPSWVPWLSPALVILGIGIFWASFRYNVWSQRQVAIDSLAEDISEAIADLVNRNVTHLAAQQFKDDFDKWCKKVSKKLENRAFFSRADQLHFDRLGYLEPVTMVGLSGPDHTHSMLRLKLERLRDIINWTQERRR